MERIMCILFLLLFSCINEVSDKSFNKTKSDSLVNNSFKAFVDNFESYQGDKIILNEEKLQKFNLQREKLDTNSVKRFLYYKIYNNPDLPYLSLFSFYPLYKIRKDSNYVLLYLAEGGAGGINSLFYLQTLDKNGSFIDALKFAEISGDCSFLKITEGEYDINGNVKLSTYENKYNCETSGLVESNLIYTNSYLLNEVGKIVKIE